MGLLSLNAGLHEAEELVEKPYHEGLQLTACTQLCEQSEPAKSMTIELCPVPLSHDSNSVLLHQLAFEPILRDPSYKRLFIRRPMSQ